MRLGSLCGIPIRLHGLTVPMLMLSCVLGGGRDTVLLAVSVLLHEGGHILMARLLRVRVVEIELMPVGGAARLESVWGLRSGQLIAVSLAGPVVNALLALVGVAAASLGVREMGALVQMNAALLLFNLMPALPMDGGRILCGILTRFMPPIRAARWGVRLGLAAGMSLLFLSARTLKAGPFNITPLLAALFIVTGASHEVQQASAAALESLVIRRGELSREGVLPVRLLAVAPDTALSVALGALTPRRVHVYLCLDDGMQHAVWLSEKELLNALMEHGDGPISRIAKHNEAEKVNIPFG